MGKSSWIGAVKKAFRHEKKHEQSRRSKWMCQGTSSSPEEEETVTILTKEAKVAETIYVPIKEVMLADTESVSPSATQAKPPESVSEPITKPKLPKPVSASTTEAKLPVSVSSPTEEPKLAESASAAIKDERNFETVEEQIKEAKISETVLSLLTPIREEKLAENVSGGTAPTTEERISGTMSSPTKDATVAQTTPAPTKEAKLAEIAYLQPFWIEDSRLAETGDQQSKHAYSVAIATAVAAEAAAAAFQAAAEVVRLATAAIPMLQGKSKEELAAIKIQSVFRGYLARRAMRALRGLERLKSLIEGSAAKRQAAAALRCVQAASRVQSQVRSRRIKMSEETQALQQQLLLKQQKELEGLKPLIGEVWDDSVKSKEQMKASLMHRQEAAIRRERAMAYAFSRQQQWRHSTKSANPMPLDLSNPNWGWNWLERWMAARPWENRSVVDQSDAASARTATHNAGQITKSYASREKPSLVAAKPVRTTKGLPPCTPSRPSSVAGKSTISRKPRLPGHSIDEESRSTISVNSQRNRRHSLTSLSIRDDESFASLPIIRSSSLHAKSTRVKSNLGSPPGNKHNIAERASGTSAKKRLSFSGPGIYSTASSPADRRLSGHGKVGSYLRNVEVRSEPAFSSGSCR